MDRISICKKYWSLSNYKRKKDFILKMVQTKEPARPLANVSNNKKRKCSRAYFLISNEYEVCLNFFFHFSFCNFSFFVSKKDQGTLCSKFRDAKQIDSVIPELEQKYNAHLERKRQATIAKEKDEIRSEK